MNKNVAALLCVNDTQLADFRAVMPRHMKQSAVPDLSAHLGVKWCPIENNVQLIRLFAGQNRFNDRLGLKEIVSKELSRSDDELAFLDHASLSLLSPPPPPAPLP